MAVTLVKPWLWHQGPATIGRVGRTIGDEPLIPCGAASERELIARLAAGDEPALVEIYRRHAGLVFGLARRLLADDTLAEDVTQEVFVYLWQQPQRYDPDRGSLRSWLGLLAHRRSVDRIRAETRRVASEERRDRAEPALVADNDIDDQLSMVWLAVRVQEALDQLPAEQREAVVLAYYGGRTYREVAIELQIPEGTAKSRLRLALAKLNELLRPALTDKDVRAWT
jgi:RNA polymerase sigma-70 factor (ECF subfamily)